MAAEKPLPVEVDEELLVLVGAGAVAAATEDAAVLEATLLVVVLDGWLASAALQ